MLKSASIKKRGLAFIIAFVMMLALFPATVFAAKVVIPHANITIVAPVTGVAPDTTATNAEGGFTSSGVTWTNAAGVAAGTTFTAGTVYRAQLTLTSRLAGAGGFDDGTYFPTGFDNIIINGSNAGLTIEIVTPPANEDIGNTIIIRVTFPATVTLPNNSRIYLRDEKSVTVNPVNGLTASVALRISNEVPNPHNIQTPGAFRNPNDQNAAVNAREGIRYVVVVTLTGRAANRANMVVSLPGIVNDGAFRALGANAADVLTTGVLDTSVTPPANPPLTWPWLVAPGANAELTVPVEPNDNLEDLEFLFVFTMPPVGQDPGRGVYLSLDVEARNVTATRTIGAIQPSASVWGLTAHATAPNRAGAGATVDVDITFTGVANNPSDMRPTGTL